MWELKSLKLVGCECPDKVKADRPSQIIQVDYIGHLPISEYKLHACTTVDTWSGIRVSYYCRKKMILKIHYQSIRNLDASYDIPTIIKSDQGIYFTGKQRQECAKEQGIIWNIYLPYNPAASGKVKWLAQVKA